MQQHSGLVTTLQVKFQRERDEQLAQYERTEATFESTILQLEQEIIALKQQIPHAHLEEQSQHQKKSLNDRVLEELENLETRYKNSDEVLRQENTQLRKQIEQISKQARGQGNIAL